MTLIPINATPQKRLFLSIIADYGLVTSVCELIDNAIDHWLISGKPHPLNINVFVNTDRQNIRIVDNAGGVRTSDLELLVAPGASRTGVTDELIGNFGVGGKRAGVALGERVEIKTRYSNEPTYALTIDNDWMNSETDWNLVATLVEDIDAGSTQVKISELRQGIDLRQVKRLEQSFGEVYANFLGPNCTIELNGCAVLLERFDNWSYPPNFSPKLAEFSIRPLEGSADEVGVRITSGLISDRDPKEGNYGVYFYCNKRLILAHEKSPEVGYYKGKAGTPHPDASLCRVIVELTGKPELMPWNSSKSGINWNHPTYQLIRDYVVEFATHFTTVSRRTKSEREEQIYPFSEGSLEKMELDSPQSLKKIVELPTPRGRKKSYPDRLLEQNASITRSKPWTIGLLDAMCMLEGVLSKRLETKNRIGLILLDSNLEIGLKEFLVQQSGQYYSDGDIRRIFQKRHLVIEEVQKHASLNEDLLSKASYYNSLRNKLIHERATVEVSPSQILDFRDVVEGILSQLYNFNFQRD